MKKAVSIVASIAIATTSIVANPGITVESKAIHESFPSASGVEYWNNSYYAIGDDSPYLFEISPDFTLLDQRVIKEYPIGDNGRIPKAIKPDYEALAITEWQGREISLILGSGSKSPTRDFGYLVDMNSDYIHECILTDLYRSLFESGNFLPEQELNIEGIAIGTENVYFANRGNSGANMIFAIEKEELLPYLYGETSELPDVEVVKVKLPFVGRYEAGLSGIAFIPETNELAFTASVEATDNAYSDGAILGSFVGVVPEKKITRRLSEDSETINSVNLRKNCSVLIDNERIVPTKVESIIVSEVVPHGYKAMLVSDNDDGTSEFFGITIHKEQ